MAAGVTDDDELREILRVIAEAMRSVEEVTRRELVLAW
jgi:hypothetical protein